jgi:hypothetical protein
VLVLLDIQERTIVSRASCLEDAPTATDAGVAPWPPRRYIAIGSLPLVARCRSGSLWPPASDHRRLWCRNSSALGCRSESADDTTPVMEPRQYCQLRRSERDPRPEAADRANRHEPDDRRAVRQASGWLPFLAR